MPGMRWSAISSATWSPRRAQLAQQAPAPRAPRRRAGSGSARRSRGAGRARRRPAPPARRRRRRSPDVARCHDSKTMVRRSRRQARRGPGAAWRPGPTLPSVLQPLDLPGPSPGPGRRAAPQPGAPRDLRADRAGLHRSCGRRRVVDRDVRWTGSQSQGEVGERPGRRARGGPARSPRACVRARSTGVVAMNIARAERLRGRAGVGRIGWRHGARARR